MKIAYENQNFINAATGENVEHLLSSLCVERSLAIMFDLEFESLSGEIQTKKDIVRFLSNKGYALVKCNANYWIDDHDCDYDASKYELDYPSLYSLLDLPEVKADFPNFIVAGFDIPRGCEYLPYWYRHHMMAYKGGKVQDHEYDDPFYLHSVFIEKSKANDLQKLQDAIMRDDKHKFYDEVIFEVVDIDNSEYKDLWKEAWGNDEREPRHTDVASFVAFHRQAVNA